MVKKKKKKIIPNPIDCLPKYSPQPRSSPPKRRIDFSVFTCTPSLFSPVKGVDSPVHNEGLYPGSHSDRNSLVTPGNVVWARTASQMWWPAEVMEERSTLSDPASDGHVLVYFYGNHSRAWINPTTDISAFEDSFEERSTHPSKYFHKALKQALNRKEQLNSCRTLSSDRCSHCNKQNHSSDKWTSCNSSATTDDFLQRGRSKRERKRKVHFDEVTFPLKSERTTRRLKIMRYLGLVAPVGSPF